MRSVAPDRPGSEASQKSCSLVKAKPTLGSLATTTDHTIQTAKESSRQGTEIQRLRRAMARPPSAQKSLSSGRQSWIAPVAASAPSWAGPWIGCISGSSGSVASRHAGLGCCPFHLPDGEVHPDQRDGDDQEQQPEAALPDAGQIVQRAEGDRQDEAAKTADEADDAADRADAVGIIDRDVLVDGRLAEAHEEAEHEGDDDEADDAHARGERHRAANALDHIVRRRIGQDEGAHDRDEEGPVHDAAGAELVGEMPAIGAEDRGRDRVDRADHAGGRDVETVDADQIARQPQRQRDEGAEDEEIIEREAPDLDVLQRLHHGRQRLRLLRRSRGAGRDQDHPW